MTDAARSGRGAVPWLAAQSVTFGVMAALLGIVANAMFLDAYGSEWLPATYIAIGAAGVVVSGAVARAARSAELIPIALVVLGGAGVAIALAWVVAAGGGASWVSIPLLVLFPILIQLGFVFIGGQGGRVLDIAGIKASFPRIMAGFPIGAILGGFLGGWLVTWSGRVEDLLLATAVAQGAFAVLVWVTGRRYASALRGAGDGGPPVPPPVDGEAPRARPSLRRLLSGPFISLIVAYQVLSAVGSQLADFLVFDRAVAYYPDPADLARFLAIYTAVMNIVSISFLVVVAGPLLRRYGLRVGIAANPFVLAVMAAVMIVALAVTGGASITLLAIVSAARIADIALTDGTTRTSINATYQVLPDATRLPVQAAVEGIGVPVAIGISGVLIVVLRALPDPLAATIAVTTVTCVVWSRSAVLLYRAYGPALVAALRRERWLDLEAPLEVAAADAVIARRLVIDRDPRAARLGLELLISAGGPGLAADLGALATSPRPDVRMAALTSLTAMGDAAARRRLTEVARASAASPDRSERLDAARALAVLGPEDRSATGALLSDPDPGVRQAALEAVGADDIAAVAPVLSGLADPSTAAAAAAAVERLGDAVVPALAAELDGARWPTPPVVARLVRAAARRSPLRDQVLARHVGHPDRELGLAVIERLVAPQPATDIVAAALDAAFQADAEHAGRILGALVAFDGWNEQIRRALEEELDLGRRRIVAGRVARFGSERLGPVAAAVVAEGPGAALGLEAVGVLLEGREAAIVAALLEPGLTSAERLARVTAPRDAPTDAADWLRSLIEDPGARWRSPWLCACAIDAARRRGLLHHVDLGPARAIGDPVVDEELILVG